MEQNQLQQLSKANERFKEKTAKIRLQSLNKQIKQDVAQFKPIFKPHELIDFDDFDDDIPEVSALDLFLKPHKFIKDDVI